MQKFQEKYYLTKKEKQEAVDIILATFPDAKAELDHENPFELLIATILSAQCTDVRVNMITKDLFKKYKSPLDYMEVSQEELQEDIRQCGLFKSKAKNIRLACQKIEKEYGGQVPKTIEELMTLPGVGRKTANVVASNAFGIPAIAVDTHVFRVSNRIGLAKAKDVLETEKQLERAIDKDKWTKAHHAIIFQGRRICSARSPKCQSCPVNHICVEYGKIKRRELRKNEKN